MSRIVVTGGGGFIGSAIVDQLVDNAQSSTIRLVGWAKDPASSQPIKVRV